jgi:hypothetical protein
MSISPRQSLQKETTDMTAFVPGLLVGFILATFAWGALLDIWLLHRPRYTAPTKRRKNRDRPERVAHGQLMTDEEAAFARKLEDGYQPRPDGVRYEWINLTGLEGE